MRLSSVGVIIASTFELRSQRTAPLPSRLRETLAEGAAVLTARGDNRSRGERTNIFRTAQKCRVRSSLRRGQPTVYSTCTSRFTIFSGTKKATLAFGQRQEEAIGANSFARAMAKTERGKTRRDVNSVNYPKVRMAYFLADAR